MKGDDHRSPREHRSDRRRFAKHPSLFLIAQGPQEDANLGQRQRSRHQSRSNAGQSATFKVDAFGDREFKGTVSQVRLNATMNQNVVTYTVVVDTDNSDETLLPYETATLEFDAGRHDNVLMVPNTTALRMGKAGPRIAQPWRLSMPRRPQAAVN